MRVLEFEVDQQRLKKKQNCDFSGIVPGSKGYLAIHVEFSEEWEGCTKIARFWHHDVYFGTHSEHAVYLENDMCFIPHEVLEEGSFYLSIAGIGTDLKIPTNKIKIQQEEDY